MIGVNCNNMYVHANVHVYAKKMLETCKITSTILLNCFFCCFVLDK